MEANDAIFQSISSSPTLIPFVQLAVATDVWTLIPSVACLSRRTLETPSIKTAQAEACQQAVCPVSLQGGTINIVLLLYYYTIHCSVYNCFAFARQGCFGLSAVAGHDESERCLVSEQAPTCARCWKLDEHCLFPSFIGGRPCV